MQTVDFLPIHIPQERYDVCDDFAYRMEYTHRASGFQGDPDQPRSKEQQQSATLQGKLGEVAFQMLCARFGVNLSLDFTIWKHGEPRIREPVPGNDLVDWLKDTQHLLPVHLKVDVKTVRGPARKWLLVRNHAPKSDVYVLMEQNEEEPRTFRIRGWQFRQFFFADDGKPWFNYPKGDYLIKAEHANWMYQRARGMESPLRTRTLMNDAYARQAVWQGPELRHDWPLASAQMGVPPAMIRTTTVHFQKLLTCIKWTGRWDDPAAEEKPLL